MGQGAALRNLKDGGKESKCLEQGPLHVRLPDWAQLWACALCTYFNRKFSLPRFSLSLLLSREPQQGKLQEVGSQKGFQGRTLFGGLRARGEGGSGSRRSQLPH